MQELCYRYTSWEGAPHDILFFAFGLVVVFSNGFRLLQRNIFFLMRVRTAHVSEDLQPGIVVEREDSIFIFLGLGYLTQYDPF